MIGTMLMRPCRCAICSGARAGARPQGLAVGAVIYGGAAGGTVGAGVILLSLLMAAGLQGAAVVATDAIISMVVTTAHGVFGFSGAMTAGRRVRAADRRVALPGAFLAKALVRRMPFTSTPRFSTSWPAAALS